MDTKGVEKVTYADLQALVIALGVFALFYVMMIRPEKKKRKQIEELQNALKVGDDVVTFGGITGKIINVGSDSITLESGAEKTKIALKKWAVKEVTVSKA